MKTRTIVRSSWLAALALGVAALAPLETIVADPPPTTTDAPSEPTHAPAKRTSTRRAAARRRPATRRTTTRRATTRRRVVRRRFVPRLTAAQRRQIRRWHARATRAEIQVWSRRDPLPIVFRALTARDRFELVPDDAYGTFSGEALERAEQALAYREDGSHHAIHPRLLQLVHRAVRHFRAPWVWVISGYRGGNPRSRHAQGRAIDLVLPGVPDRRLAAYLRPQGFVGVGIYPTSGFVHLDVRARSYFWSDSSGPDQSNRERRILPTMGPRFDRIARNLGAEPVPDLVEATDDEELEAELEEGGAPIAADLTTDVEIEPATEGTRPELAPFDAGTSSPDASTDAGVGADT